METTSSSSEEASKLQKKKKEGLGWIEWLRGWFYLFYEMLFQRIMASHLHNPMPLPPVNDLTCIVTGSTSGIGLEIARQLAQSGAHVVMAVRNTKAAQELIQKWQVDTAGLGIALNVEVMVVDLLSLDSVVRFAEAWNARAAPLHVLINNAGIFSIGEPQKFSKDGYEEHLQVNHLAPALLSTLLLPSLIRGSPSRIVNVNSIMHHVGFVDPEDMNVTSGKRKYSSMVGYSSSKLAQIMFSSVLNKRLPAEAGISVLCVSPGIVQTNVARDLPKFIQAGYHLIPYFIFNAQEGIVANNDTAEVSVDQYHRYKEDVDLMAKLNFDAYRFSISWSRIFPNGTGEVNWKGVAYYNRLINYLLERGITPYANLYHYDLPQALELRYTGLLSGQVVKDFADYADFCFKTFGDRVKNWITFNEPRVVAALGYDNGLDAPGRCSKVYGNCSAGNSGTEPYIVAHNLILSHAAAVQRYREKYQEEQKGRIGIVLDFTWFEPLTRSKADNYAAQRARDFQIGWFIHPLVYGEYPRTIQEIVGDRLPKFTKEEVKLVKGSSDFFGINQYTTYYMYDPHQSKPKVPGYQEDGNVGFAFAKNGVPIGPRANSYWLYNVPWGMYKSLMYIKERYGNPTMILSENGMDDPGNVTLPKGLHDTTRINYYKGYLTQLKKAVDDGANVVGYFAWSLLDNFEWRLGYTSRFGIVYVDFKTLKRYPKMSAYWFKQLLTKKH